MVKNFKIFFLVIPSLFKRLFIAHPRQIKKVVVIQLAQMGDMVCTTPMFRAIKKHYPHCELIVVGKPLYKDLLANNPDVDKYLEYTNVQNIARVLRKMKIDFGCVVTTGFNGLATLILADIPIISAPQVVGYNPQQTRLYRFLLSFVNVTKLRFASYVPEQILSLLVPIGVLEKDTRKHLGYSEKASLRVEEFFIQNGIQGDGHIIGLSCSSGNKIKNWGGKNFATLVQELHKLHSVQFIVIGSSQDRNEIAEMKQSLSPEISACFVLDQDLDILKALISRLSLFISVDTGPIYIAEAFGIPTIDIVGPVDEREQPPRGPKHRIVALPNRIPEVHILNARVYNSVEARRQIESITVPMVLTECESLIKEL